ncbi:MAG: hypothetical protein HPPSJP_3090 [Candidatus Hepatoplasma scabrum]|nr:MAG: hypothetical protein HPPSJP_3090 [Candidatus Hepatoplasma sp.]
MDKNNKLKKIKINWIEIILFLFAIVTSSYFIFANIDTNNWDTYLIYVDIFIGIIAAIALSKRYRYAWILLIIDAVFYGSVMFATGSYALATVNVIFLPIILIFAGINWKKEGFTEQNLIKTRKLNFWQGIFIVTLITILTVGFAAFSAYVVIDLIGEDEVPTYQIALDAFSASISLVAFIFSMLRYRETFFLYTLLNIVKIIMFSLILFAFDKQEGSDKTTLIISLILAISYFFNALYGLFMWNKGSKEIISTDI